MKKNIEQVLARHFSGEASTEDQKFLKQWIDANQSNKDEFQRINLAYQLSSFKSDDVHRNNIYSKINKRIQSENQNDDRRKTSIQIKRYWFTVAAAILLLISTTFVFLLTTKQFSRQSENAHELIVKSNPAGQKLKVFLPDGSIVWLNSTSTLSYQKEFTDTVRDLILKGEAYFEVYKDARRPFIVHTGNISTIALGTSFNIEAYDSDKITVSLTSGSVNVESFFPGKELIKIQLNPGEGALYNANDGIEIQKIKIDINAVRLWKDGILRLNNASLAETVTSLERWYGVNIKVNNNSSKNWKVNGVFDNEYLENVLNSLSFSQGFEYSMIGNKVEITIK